MKKVTFFIIMLMAFVPTVFAQNDGSKREKLIKEGREFKMNFLAKEMELTEAQKQKFFPLYEEMSQKRVDCYKEARQIEKKLKKEGKDLSDAEYQQLLEAQAKAKAMAADIEKVYSDKFAEFLSAKQIYKLKEAENAFAARIEEMRLNRKKDKKR